MAKVAKVSLVLVFSYIAFVSLGVPDGLRGVAWPGIQESFSVPIDAITSLLVLGTIGYMLSSFFSAYLARRLSIAVILACGCLALALNQLVQGATGLWSLFVLSALLGGLGSGSIDAGLNTYIAQNHSPSAMQWLHAFFGVGISAGPFIMTASLALLMSWRPGYIFVGALQLLLALLLYSTRRKWLSPNEAVGADTSAESAGKAEAGSAGAETSTLTNNKANSNAATSTNNRAEASIGETLRQFPALLSMLMFFLYTGLELGLGLWAYSLLTQSRGVAPTVAGIITGGYWAMFTTGRIIAGFFSMRIRIRRLIAASIVGAGLGMLLVLLNVSGLVDILGIAITGFAIAPIFPALVTDTIRRVGARHEANTIGMQVASAGFGSAIIPSLAGVLAREFSLEAIPVYILVLTGLLMLGFVLSLRVGVKER